MSDVILSNEVIIYLLSEMIIYTLMVIAFLLTPNRVTNIIRILYLYLVCSLNTETLFFNSW
jgi:hypothetical protein